METFVPTPDELERVFVNNTDLKRIDAYLKRFNPIKIMRMEEMEIRHSAILAWLLNPHESHGLGDRFLREFLSEAMRGQSNLGSPTALDISQADLRDTEVRREWQNIDIFVLLPSLNWAFIIENKYRSSQHEGQLSKYSSRVKSIFEAEEMNLKVRGIFLTLLDEDPEDEHYAPIQYDAICEILPRILADPTISVKNDVQQFINHYIEVIMEATGMSDELHEMENLARQLYRNHKKVLDFVFEYGASTDFVLALEAVFRGGLEYGKNSKIGQQEIMFNWHNNTQASFLPKNWVEGLGGDDSEWPGCEKWWAGYPLICWLQLFDGDEGTTGQLRLFAEVGPVADHELRSSLIARIQEAAENDGHKKVSFQKGAAQEGKKYSKFLKANNIEIKDIHDADEIERAMRALIERFQPVFESVGKILPEFKSFGVLDAD